MGCIHSRAPSTSATDAQNDKKQARNRMDRNFSISVSDIKLPARPPSGRPKWSHHSSGRSSLGLPPKASSPLSPRRSDSGTPSPRHSLSGSTPPSVESFLAKRNNKKRRLPDLPKFGAPLYQQDMRKLTKQDELRDSITIKPDYKQLPSILIMLKKHLIRFHGYQKQCIFANGNEGNIAKYQAADSDELVFVRGFVSKVDVYGMKQLIEGDKLEQFEFEPSAETHYAMVFSELIKLWLSYLAQRILDFLPGSVFEIVKTIEQFEAETYKMPEPNLSTFLFILDICVEVVNNSGVNKMTARKMASVIGPCLYKDKDVETNNYLKPYLINFTEVGILWRKQA